MRKVHILELQGLDDNLSERDKLVVKTYHHLDLEGHEHNFFELAYVIEGSTTHTLNDVSSTLSVGDYFIVDYGSVHSYSGSENLTLINCLFLPEVIDDTLKGCCSFDELVHGCFLRYYKLYLGQTSVNRVFHDVDGRILQLLKGMMNEYQEKLIGYTDIFRCRLLEILIITMRSIVDNNSISTKNTTILDAIEFINSHYQRKNILAEFCKRYHFTPEYISRRFKSETGFTVSKYLQKVRIEKCCELLACTDMNISDIAGEVGYHDIKFFNEIFRRMLNMSPSEYRKLA